MSPYPHDTAMIYLAPNQDAPVENVRTSGYVDLSIPLLLEQGKLQPQGDKPVPVLVHAFSERGSEQGSIALSSGQAQNEIMPDQGIKMVFTSLSDTSEADDAELNGASSEMRRRDDAAFFESRLLASSVVAYLGQAAQTRESITALNDLLQNAGHKIRVSART
jgi:hypothetical protein